MNWSKQNCLANWRRLYGSPRSTLPCRNVRMSHRMEIRYYLFCIFTTAISSKGPFHRPCRLIIQDLGHLLITMLVGPPREAHRMTNKEPGHLRIELPGFNVLNCKHFRDIIFQLPQVRKRQFHIQLRKIQVQPCIEVVDREFCIALAWTQFLLGNSAQTVINAGRPELWLLSFPAPRTRP